MKYFFKDIFYKGAFQKNLLVETDAAGKILATSFSNACPADATAPAGIFLPGFANGHSHAFQYAMAGLAEHVGRSITDNFWTWRQTMYQLARAMTPETLLSIATELYANMVAAGITSVAEFHYIHHGQSGAPYKDASAMADALAEAATRAGIQLCLLPVYYRLGDFGKQASPEQNRFVFKNVHEYQKYVSDLRSQYENNPQITVGSGLHSLRAASQEEAREILTSDAHSGPIHIHISEQVREVESCMASWGARPVEWLCHNIDLTNRHNLVHATHLTTTECESLATSKARVVICPSTEGNLGDGFFPLHAYHAAGGDFCVGTDSHVGLCIPEELRWLDYGQRLKRQQRNPLCLKPGEDSGAILYEKTLLAGRKAIGIGEPYQIGQPLEGILLRKEAPLLANRSPQRWLSTFVFTSGAPLINKVMNNGKFLVENGLHLDANRIASAASQALKELVTSFEGG